MKTIKLKLFDRVEFTKDSIKNVPVADNNEEKKRFISNLKKKESNTLIAFNFDEMKLDYLLQITNEDEILASMFYNPILTFFKQAYDTNIKAELVKLNFKIIDDNDEIKIVDIKDFSAFMQLKLNAIIMLQTSIEAFINYSIPQDDFLIKNNKTTKKEIERSLSFRDKLKFLSNDLKEINFDINNKEDKKTYDSFLELNSIRKEIIHMKTNRDEFLESFIDALRKALGYDLNNQFKNSMNFMNKIKPHFIELIDIKNDI